MTEHPTINKIIASIEEATENDILESDFKIGNFDLGQAGKNLLVPTESGFYRVEIDVNGKTIQEGAAGLLGMLPDNILETFKTYMMTYLENIQEDKIKDLYNILSKTEQGKAVSKILKFTANQTDLLNEDNLSSLFSPPLEKISQTLTTEISTGTLTRFEAPSFTKYKSIKAWDDVSFKLKKAATERLENTAFKTFKRLLKKALSSAVDASKQAITSSNSNFLEGGNNLKELLQKSLCGNNPEESAYALNTDEKSIAAATIEVANSIGAWDGASKPTNKTMEKFIDSVSSVLVNGEIKTLLNGNPSDETLKLVFSVANTTSEDDQMTDIFSSPEQLGSLFSGLGNLIEDDLIDEILMGENNLPVDSNICRDPQSLKDFDNLRKQLLEDKGLTPEQAQEQIDKARERSIEAASDFLDAMLNPDEFNDPKFPKISCIPEEDTIESPITKQEDKVNDIAKGKASPHQEEIEEDFRDLFEDIEISLINDTSDYFNYVLSSKDGEAFSSAILTPLIDNSKFSTYIDKMYYGGEGEEWEYTSFRRQILGGASIVEDSENATGQAILYSFPISVINSSLYHNILPPEGNSELPKLIRFDFLNNNLYSLSIKDSLSEYTLSGTCTNNFDLQQYSQYFGSTSSGNISNSPTIFNNKTKSDLKIYFPNSVSPVQWQPILGRIYKNIHKVFAGSESNGYYKNGYKTSIPSASYSEEAMEVLGIGDRDNPAFYYGGPNYSSLTNHYSGYYKSYLKLSPSPNIDPDVDFFMSYNSIAKQAAKNINNFLEDNRINADDPQDVIEPPYGLIVDQNAAATIEGTLRATLKTILVEQFMGMLHISSMTKLDTDKDGILNHVYTNNLVKKIKQELIRMGDLKFYGDFGTRKTFYYNFKEQIVQSFSNRIKCGQITPSLQEQTVLNIINIKQAHWKEPANAPNKLIVKAKKYHRFMEETEVYSDIILRRYIDEEIKEVTKTFSERLNPAIKNIQSLFFGNKSSNSKFFLNEHDLDNWPCNTPKNIEDDWYSKSYESGQYNESPLILEKFIKIERKNNIPESIKAIMDSEEMSGVISFESLNKEIEDGAFGEYSFEQLFDSISIGLRIVMLYKDNEDLSPAPTEEEEEKKYTHEENSNFETGLTVIEDEEEGGMSYSYKLGVTSRENMSFNTKKIAKKTKAVITGIETEKPIVSMVLCETSIPVSVTPSSKASEILKNVIQPDNYDLQFPCLITELMSTEKYKLYFEYLFPIKTLVSLAVIYHQNYFMSSMRRRKFDEDGMSNLNNYFFSVNGSLFDGTKSVCKTLFEASYYSKYEKTYKKYVTLDDPKKNALKENSSSVSASDKDQKKLNIFRKKLRQPKNIKLIDL